MADALVQQRHAQHIHAVGQSGFRDFKTAEDIGVAVALHDLVSIVEVEPVVLQEIGVEGQAQQPVFTSNADVEFGDSSFGISLGVEAVDVAHSLDVINHTIVCDGQFHGFIQVVVEGDFGEAAVVGLVAGADKQVGEKQGEGQQKVFHW